VTTPTGQYYGDALLTVDGAVRLYVGGPYSGNDQLVQLTRADGAVQFVGDIQGDGNQASGTGVVIGLNCAAPAVPGRFCMAAAPAEINVSSGASDGAIQGNLQVTTSTGAETWSLNLVAWDNYYLVPAYVSGLTGVFQESLAEFAGSGVTTVTVDAQGGLSFQSADTGCIGAGTLTPHLDGSFDVYDIVLTINSCQGGYGYLNGVFDGLATTTPSDYWDYDLLIRVWLSTPAGAVSPAALIMLSQ
jgi:hypothetical protein